MPTMVFHCPYPLDPQSLSASGIRPVRMFEAFRELGYEVLDISGYAAERKKKFAALRQRIRAGAKIDFCYSENATIPPMVTEKRHLPPHPFLDLDIFAYLKRHDIPIGVFYRDIYWLDDDYASRVGQPIAAAMTALYRYELWGYNQFCRSLYLPSLEMGEYLPNLNKVRYMALPPGGEIVASRTEPSPLSVFYIGGIGNKYYQLHKLFAAAKRVPEMTLTVCTPRHRWEPVAHEYPEAENISVVHRSGPDKDPLFAAANLCYVSIEPEPYGAFASPVKLYEYIGRGKAVLALKNTLAAKVVTSHGIGFSTEHTVDAMEQVFRDLSCHPDKISQATANCEQFRESNTWLARASAVVDDLAG